MAGPRTAVYAVVAEVEERVGEEDKVDEAESRSRMMVVSRWVFSVCLRDGRETRGMISFLQCWVWACR